MHLQCFKFSSYTAAFFIRIYCRQIFAGVGETHVSRICGHAKQIYQVTATVQPRAMHSVHENKW